MDWGSETGLTSRSWPGALVVVLIAAFYAFGLPAINARIPGTAPEPAGVTVDIGNGVSVVTPAGWSANLPKMKPNETLALTRDTSSLVATTFEWTGSEGELIERTRNLVEGIQHFSVRNAPTPFRSATGLTGSTYAYFGERADGRMWVFALPGGKSGLAVRFSSIPGQGAAALRDAQAIVDSVRLKEVR